MSTLSISEDGPRRSLNEKHFCMLDAARRYFHNERGTHKSAGLAELLERRNERRGNARCSAPHRLVEMTEKNEPEISVGFGLWTATFRTFGGGETSGEEQVWRNKRPNGICTRAGSGKFSENLVRPSDR
ncbi:hypothetical protein Tcan_18276 [Toxocara canis]|uniref:Uncharacterized protein n=1 Tax=Toxocara canis TaxID=6265 RepID=A0A0B2VGB1_TOXCA|nr:hypothetical protein Tcan_18276 [Toxocara canis]